MEDGPDPTSPTWAKIAAIVTVVLFIGLTLAVLIPLAMRLIAWAWAGVA
jgi:uncharacterized protein involved in exopolysaccharide biosynthesis